MLALEQVSVINDLREQRNASREKAVKTAGIEQSSSSSSRAIYTNSNMMLTLLTSINLNLDSVDLSPNSILKSLCSNPLCEYVCTLSLKGAQFCCSGRHHFGNYPWCSPYLLLSNKSVLLSIFGLVAVVFIGLTPIKRQSQFVGNTRAGALMKTTHLGSSFCGSVVSEPH